LPASTVYWREGGRLVGASLAILLSPPRQVSSSQRTVVWRVQEGCNAEHHITCQRHHEICDRRRTACWGPIRMRVKPRPGARAESRLHPSQRRRASEGQLHASHLGHSGDWREANERLDQHTFAPSFRVRQWPPQRRTVLRFSRTRSAQPCCSSFPPASSLCGFTIGGPRSRRASERNGCVPCRGRPRVRSAPLHAVTRQKTTPLHTRQR
jgi:hypothetical protein